ncbi:hypothetical protein [Hyphococcus sp.]|uniref:hypothetical protein n=1 Tax=Hyphococcus sp. TaxID=2038636 RepID=UPI0035C77CF3
MSTKTPLENYPADYPFKELYDRSEAAAYCKIAPKTFDRYRRHPQAPEPVRYSRRPYWSAADLNEIIRLHMQSPAEA